jgi:hypothetical protein
VIKAYKVTLDQLVQLEIQDLQVLLDQLDPQVILEIPGLQDLQVTPEFKDQLVQQVLPDQVGLMVPQDPQDPLERKEHKVT